MKIYFLNITLLLLFSSTSFSQTSNIKFTSLSFQVELSQNTIQSVFQDSDGFLWIGTSDGGLNKYDGYNITNYDKEFGNLNSISDRNIFAIVEDNNKNLWISTKNGLNKFDKTTNSFLQYFVDINNNEGLRFNSIRSLQFDSYGKLWLGGESKYLTCFDPATAICVHYDLDEVLGKPINEKIIYDIFIGSDSTLWIAYSDNVISFNIPSQKFDWFDLQSKSDVHSEINFVTNISQDTKKNMWFSTRGNGVFKFNSFKNEFTHYYAQPGAVDWLQTNFIYIVYQDSKENIWIGSDNGLYLFNEIDNKFTLYSVNRAEPESLSDNTIIEIYEDNSGVLWIGTMLGGINYIRSSQKAFKHVSSLGDGTGLSNPGVFSICEDSDGFIWYSTFSGLNKYNPASGQYEYFYNNSQNSNSLATNRVWSVAPEKNEYENGLWIGTSNGMDYYDKKTNKFKHYKPSERENSISHMEVYFLYSDSRDYLWIGTLNGLDLFNKKTKHFTNFKNDPSKSNSLSDNTIWCIFEDSFHDLWIGTTGGLNKFNYSDSTFISYQHDPKLIGSISSNEVISIIEAEDHNLWMATAEGINKFNREDETFQYYNKKDGLPGPLFWAIQQDDNGYFWVSSNHGLSKFHPEQKEVTNYDYSDGLQSNEFNASSLKGKNGILYFGGINGVTIFHPDSIKSHSYNGNTVFTNFLVFGKEVSVGDSVDGEVILSTDINYMKKIELPYNKNVLTFEFSSLDFNYPEKNLYSFRMLGVDIDWSSPSNINSVTYNLAPGDYEFLVKSANIDGVWNEDIKSLKISVSPPWWQTWLFKLLLALIIAAAIIVSYTQRIKYVNKQKEKLESLVEDRTREIEAQNEILSKQSLEIENSNVELEQLNAELEQRVVDRTFELIEAKELAEEADKLKSEFLAQMSHEIRTPINVVLSFTSLVHEEIKDKIDEDLLDAFSSINNAGSRIIRTIDLILNMSEIQAGTYDYNPKKINFFDDIITNTYTEFYHMAKQKGIDLKVKNNAGESDIFADEYTLKQTVVNLVDNAIKYTDEGEVSVSLSRNEDYHLILKVTDTGIGISEEYLPNLFKPFSQEEQGYTRKFEGNGLGLALVKKYCELNSAEIEVNSKKGEGTEFIITYKNSG